MKLHEVEQLPPAERVLLGLLQRLDAWAGCDDEDCYAFLRELDCPVRLDHNECEVVTRLLSLVPKYGLQTGKPMQELCGLNWNSYDSASNYPARRDAPADLFNAPT